MAPHLPVYLLSFGFIVLAAKQIGEFVTRFRLPLITGYLLTGIIAGPFVLSLIPQEAIDQMRFIDELSLGFIAFAAGSEMYLKDLRSRFKSIGWITVGLVLMTFAFITIVLFLLSGFIPFMSELSDTGRLAVAILGGAILVARSPSSAIAIVNELRAQGPFTRTVLGVTVIMDVVVIILFAVAVSIADVLLTGLDFNLGFIVLVAMELLIAAVLGFFVGRILMIVLSTHLRLSFKAVLILLVGMAVFILSDNVREITHTHLPFEILIEPLLVAMIASFIVTNFSQHRPEFMEIIHETGPYIYVIFFTLTGDSLALNVLVQLWPIALILFLTRVVSVFIGSYIGGNIAGDPPRYNRIWWMGFVTQAGVALGLAREVAVEFTEFGNAFATLIIATVVLNEIFGPLLFKFAIRRVDESHLPSEHHPDEIRDAIVCGVNGQTMALARRLQSHEWTVTMIDTDKSHVDEYAGAEFDIYHLTELTPESLGHYITDATDALIGAFADDNENYQVCGIAFEHFGIPRLVTLLNDLTFAEQFSNLGVEVIYPSVAIVALLDQLVRTPQSAGLLLHNNPDYDIEQVTINNPDVIGLALRDLKLSNGVLVLGIMRDSHSIVPHGYTILNENDEVMIVGEPQSLAEVKLKLGY